MSFKLLYFFNQHETATRVVRNGQEKMMGCGIPFLTHPPPPRKMGGVIYGGHVSVPRHQNPAFWFDSGGARHAEIKCHSQDCSRLSWRILAGCGKCRRRGLGVHLPEGQAKKRKSWCTANSVQHWKYLY